MTSLITTALAEGDGLLRIPEVVLRVYSKKVEFAAMPQLKFDQFATIKTDLKSNPGDGITFFKYNNITRGGQLTEAVDMETQALSGAQTTILLKEYGNAVAVTEFLITTSFADIMGDTARLLARDYSLVMDELARDTLMDASNEVFANNAANANAISTGNILTVEEVKDAVEILATNNAPKRMGDHWACVVSPHQSRGLRDDAEWITVARLDPQRLYNGEIGRIDDVVFIETTQVDKTANEAATPVEVHTAIMLGDNAFGKAVATPVSMRDNGVQDFGRKRSLAWYSVLGEGILNDDNIVLIKTA